MNLINETIGKIEPVEVHWLERATARQLELTKPPGSLGKLEEIANRLCAIQASLQPNVEKREIFVFAASHGVSKENVSPYPASVTAQMVLNFLRGGAAQGRPGIIVNSPANRYVIIRNIQSRNWTSGIQINGDSRVTIESSRFENNINHGIEVNDNARVKVDKSEVIATGFRLNPATGDFPTTSNPNPGNGISFKGNSSGAVYRNEVAGSFRAGISNQTSGNVTLQDVYLFDNGTDGSDIRRF